VSDGYVSPSYESDERWMDYIVNPRKLGIKVIAEC
jgi:hypothetical protein